MKKNAEWQSQKKFKNGQEPPVEPLYTIQDSEAALRHRKTDSVRSALWNLTPDMKIVFNDAGHILGLGNYGTLGDRRRQRLPRLYFSGDLGVLKTDRF